ncbi:DUF1176 domain-containing protein [Rhizobiales bacterium]|uniref:DUF1176 domain-containing protein n=1 Tax=Hongsoonwoonella zoysiae TaxID=2821844 RepID=UPI0015607909|nr:DUF1176 domain-containing protein [Hongsoonwoonella zoysiae]NRG17677.1 DUF1176 domain-containing protein [Hongsoonwoonella zoysiae]
MSAIASWGTVAILLWAGAAFAAEPVSGQFRDWKLDCDGTNACTAFTLSGEKANGRPLYRLRIKRGPPPDETFALSFDVNGERPDHLRKQQWRIDEHGPRVLGEAGLGNFGHENAFFVTGEDQRTTLLPELNQGERLRISYIDALGAPHEASFSLFGLSAALEKMNDVQGARGEDIEAPEDEDPVAPPSRAEMVETLGIPHPVLEAHRLTSSCEDPQSENMGQAAPVIAVLSQTSTLYAIPCTRGAGRTTYRLYLRDSGEIGGLETLYFALYDPRFGWLGTDILDGVKFDEEEGTLNAVAQRRSDRHCGYRAKWKWRDYAFRLVEFQAPRTCADSARLERIYP